MIIWKLLNRRDQSPEDLKKELLQLSHGQGVPVVNVIRDEDLSANGFQSYDKLIDGFQKLAGRWRGVVILDYAWAKTRNSMQIFCTPVSP